MTCPVCNRAPARRACPALAQTICPVCCGTKRLVEISCPSDCAYLTAAQRHPAAVVQRQQARDVAALMPTLRHLTERQHQLFFLLQTVIARHQPEGFVRLLDADVAEGAGSVARTLETAARGVIYEQPAGSRVGAALAAELKQMVEHVRQQGAPVGDLEAAAVLRAIEQGARRPEGEGSTAYLELMARLLHVRRPAGDASPQSPATTLILP
jgi:hypothetical protein